MSFVGNEFLSTSGMCHYCYDEKRALFHDPVAWAIHILQEHPSSAQAIRLKERNSRVKVKGS